ncbi:hypothetical protein Poli38472_009030 [Pythium oligandrum]|uniref:Cyclic phosphodiesterase n=1 Tax=Pythium oligandrum TaxID=41045 RepID=A0A8K1CKY3_PYTOL|nr:hypothetical protein Poli38472_009030 [Pythium oligandrum]|eukprot:TMW64863.1 hypothetical protein Poli38472_009030 [Pythium oligandrum]
MAESSKANDAIYATAEFVGYSLWLVPHAAAERELQGVIDELATRLETPSFLPHMTLLGGIMGLQEEEVVRKTQLVADGLETLDLQVSAVSSKELLYFQCVFALLKMTPALENAHEHAKQVYERLEEPSFMPHVSLVYGDLSTEDRRALAQEFGPRFDGTQMKMERLQLWNTTGPVKQWKLVKEIALRR